MDLGLVRVYVGHRAAMKLRTYKKKETRFFEQFRRRIKRLHDRHDRWTIIAQHGARIRKLLADQKLSGAAR